jgi:hypothetical protein
MSYAGLIRVSIIREADIYRWSDFQAMDCRVKPGNDVFRQDARAQPYTRIGIST